MEPSAIKSLYESMFALLRDLWKAAPAAQREDIAAVAAMLDRLRDEHRTTYQDAVNMATFIAAALSENGSEEAAEGAYEVVGELREALL